MTAPRLDRWRLVLGEPAHQLGDPDPTTRARDAALDWLYGRDPALARRGIRTSGAGSGQGTGAGDGPSVLTTFDWLDEIHRLFPRESVHRLERDALERYQIHELVTDPATLARVEPNAAVLRAVLQVKHLMNPDVLQMARQLVQQVVADLVARLATETRRAFGSTRSRRPTRLPTPRGLDLRRTLRANLAHYQPEHRRVVIREAHFRSRSQREVKPWQVILLVDQSGSMVSSVMHSAITAACLWGIPGVRPHLVAFDTTVVDLTREIDDPTELLLKVNLGGGTDIDQALRYGAQLVDHPRRTVVVLITDLYEGGSEGSLLRTAAGLVEQGTVLLVLTALDEEAAPAYDVELGQRLADLGAHVGAMTPGHLVDLLAEVIDR